ncbi:MAG: hypothetical protein GWP91_20940 [Rhodobacterales bacterium]|nr:hypothetical protein [Rhodobacterales bacterium]
MRPLPFCLLLTSCNAYDLYIIDRVSQGTWPANLDVLLVMDRSQSMSDESADLGAALVRWSDDMQMQYQALETDNLSDAVDNAVHRAKDSGPFTDVQFGVLTADVVQTAGALQGTPALISRQSPTFAEDLQRSVLCEVSCLEDLPSTPGLSCDELIAGPLTSESMDCLCGPDVWRANCGDDDEEVFENVLLAMCRSVADPPEVCFESYSLFETRQVGSNSGLIREDSVFIPVVFTDEGDASRRVGQESAVPKTYFDAFQSFDFQVIWVVVGPTLDNENVPVCPGRATGWGTLRYQWMVDQTGGLSLPIHDGACGPADFDTTLERLSDLISGNRGALSLSRPADVDTLLVTVDGEVVPQAHDELVDGFNFPRLGPGWTYRANPPTVILRGEYAPLSGQEIEARYLPL